MAKNFRPETLRRRTTAREWLIESLGTAEPSTEALHEIAISLQRLARRNHLRFWRGVSATAERRNCVYSMRRMLSSEDLGIQGWGVDLILELRAERTPTPPPPPPSTASGDTPDFDFQMAVLHALGRIEALLDVIARSGQ